jgi:hypothetical protein
MGTNHSDALERCIIRVHPDAHHLFKGFNFGYKFNRQSGAPERSDWCAAGGLGFEPR